MREPDAVTDRLAQSVVGAAIAVHRVLGPGFLEAVYENALCVELDCRAIRFERQKVVPLHYRGRHVADHRLDLVIGGRIVVELKTVDGLAPIHVAQMISYLTATQLMLGLLINFRVPVLKDGIHRVIRS